MPTKAPNSQAYESLDLRHFTDGSLIGSPANCANVRSRADINVVYVAKYESVLGLEMFKYAPVVCGLGGAKKRGTVIPVLI